MIRDRFQKCNNYALYYGKDKLNQLSHYDIAIIEPSAHKKREILELKEKDTIVIAYVSVIEVIKDSIEFRSLNYNDFIVINNAELKNEKYNTYMVSLKSKKWRNILYHKIGKYINLYKYDGIFFDTIGNVELNELNNLDNSHQFNLAIEFIKSIRDNYSDIILIQNNGLERLCLSTSNYIDGICWENPPIDDSKSKVWTNKISERLSLLKEENNLQILVLLEQDVSDENINYPLSKYSLTKKMSSSNNYLFYNAPVNYISLIE